MRNLLIISHRFPYPPDRGEKIRLWHLLRHLARSYRVFLGCLADDRRDWQYLPKVAPFCAELGCFGIDKRRQKLRALAQYRPGRPLMLGYYDHPPLRRWIGRIAAREAIDLVYIYSTAMAPYASGLSGVRMILDMQDVDSEKWADYARGAGWPARLVWAREARTLLAYERRAAMACERTLLVTAAECQRFAELAPESRDRVTPLENGVDLDFFADAPEGFPNPYPPGDGPWLTLVGNMDYWPNVGWRSWAPIPIGTCSASLLYPASSSPGGWRTCAPILLTRRSSSRRCASPVVCRTRCWRAWPCPVRSSPRPRRSRVSGPNPAVTCWSPRVPRPWCA